MRRHHRRCGCGCQKPINEIVHPVKHNVVHKCTEETIKHVHPSHTTVKNHHLVKNKHVFPHSTSVQNTMDSVDIYGNPYQTGPQGPGGNQVGGAMQPGCNKGKHMHHHHPHHSHCKKW